MIFTVLRRYFLIAILIQIAVVSVHANSYDVNLRRCAQVVIEGQAHRNAVPATRLNGEPTTLARTLANLGLTGLRTPDGNERGTTTKLIAALGITDEAASEIAATHSLPPQSLTIAVGPINDRFSGFLLGNSKTYFQWVSDFNDLNASAQPTLLLSHALLNKLEKRQRLALLRQSFHSLADGGEMRHSISLPTNIPTDQPKVLAEVAQGLVREALVEPHQLAVFLTTHFVSEQTKPTNSLLIVVRKAEPTVELTSETPEPQAGASVFSWLFGNWW